MASVTKSKATHRVKRAAASARILEATERLLSEGERFTEIPVERLLSEANVSRSTFYVHFADKSALLVALAERAVQDVTEAGDQWWQFEHHAGPEGAASTVREMTKVYRKHAPVIRTLHEVAAYDDEVRDLWRQRRDHYAKIVADRVRLEQRDGLVPRDIDVDLMAAIVTQMVDNAILEHIAHGSPRKDKQLADTIARMG